MQTPNHKSCRTCRESKPASEFHFTPSGNRRHQCKACDHRRKAQTRDYAIENARRRARPEKRRAESRAYYRAHRRQEIDRAIAERKRGGARLRERLYAWRRRHPGCTPPTEYGYLEAVLRDPCAYCGKPSRTFDHIEPMSGGGDAGVDNITGACAKCNSRKSDSPLLHFLLRTA